VDRGRRVVPCPPGLDALPHNPVGKAARATFNLVVGSPSFGDAAVHFANFAAGHRLFTGWNVGNDKAKVTDEFDRLGADRGEMDWVDGRVLFNEALRRTWTGRHPGAGLKDAYGHYFGPGWEQPKPHNALDDAVHAAHVLLAVCRDLAGSGLRPELVSKMPGRLGSDWRPDFTVGEPVRRGMLPPQSRCGGLFQADQWREAQDLPLRERCGGAFPSVADRPGLSDDDSVDAVVIAARERRQLHRLRVEGNVVDGPVHLPLPVREREAFEAAQEAKAVKAAESMRTPQAPWAQSAAGYGPTAD